MKKTYISTLLACLCFLAVTTGPVSAQDPTAVVERAYEDILGRKADKAGMRMFRSKMIDDGWTEKQVREALRKSPESNKQGSDDIIKRAYEDLLGRQPDRGGLQLYREKISKDHWSEKQVRDSLRESQEYKNHHK